MLLLGDFRLLLKHELLVQLILVPSRTPYSVRSRGLMCNGHPFHKSSALSSNFVTCWQPVSETYVARC